MDQKQSDALRDVWFAKEKKKKNFIIALLICVVVLIILFVILIWFSYLKNEQPEEISLGVKMQNNCLEKFQDFIKNYGQDYSKCLVDYNFNEKNCGGVNPNTKEASNINVIVVLDSSGSMAEKINSQPKIDIAKKAVSDFLAQMPQGVNTGLIVYGQKGSNSSADKNLSCKGIEEVVKLGPNNSSNIISAMNSFSPSGWTPIADSFEFAKSIFLKEGTSDKDYLILVSDGIESCDGNPFAAADDLTTAVPNTTLNIIGFTNDYDTQSYLEKIVNLSGGSYLTAVNSSSIVKAFDKELLAIKKECINETMFRISSGYAGNNLNNLNCWLATYKKEADAFTENLSHTSTDAECGPEISAALQSRQSESWGDKQTLIGKDDVIYNKINSDFNSQLEAINSQLDALNKQENQN